MDEVTTTDGIQLVEVILHEDILQAHLTIGITDIKLSLPFPVGETNSDAHVGNGNTALQFIFLVLWIDVSRIKEDTS